MTAAVQAEEQLALDGTSVASCSWPGCVHGGDITRNRWGQPSGPFGEDGKITAVPRVSTVSHDGLGGGGAQPLMGWAVRRALVGITRDRGLRDAVSVAVSRGDPDSDEMRELATRAQDLGGSAVASAAGTALHEVVLGGLTGAPVEFADDAAQASLVAAAVTLDAAGLDVLLVEQFIVVRQPGMGCAGSYDALVRRRSTGTFHILDVKTSAKLNDRAYPQAVAAQVAAYSRGERYCPVNGWLRDPPVDPHLGYLLSVPLDGGIALLDELDLDIGWRGLQIAFELRAWRREKPLLP